MTEYIGIDVGGTHIKYGVVDPGGSIKFAGSKKTRIEKEAFLNDIKSLIMEVKHRTPIAGAGISFPGFIDSERGVLVTAGVFNAFLAGFPMKEYLLEETGVQCEIENDVNSVALAEKWTGKGKGYSDFLCLTIGSGIGGAIILNDRLYRGKVFPLGNSVLW